MYLISLLPYELNDDILILLNNFELAMSMKRFWAASRLYSIELNLSEDDLLNIIPYLLIENRYGILISTKYTSVVKQLLLDPRIDPSVEDNDAIC